MAVCFHDHMEPIYLEVPACEVVCGNDSAKLLEKTIVHELTPGLGIIATKRLHIYLNSKKKIQCWYGNKPARIPTTQIQYLNQTQLYITGDLAFYMMALGRE